MKIGILSGKGGTGKTFSAVNLAVAASNVTYLDCDIEAPNGYLFLKSEDEITSEEVVVTVPDFTDKCIGCKKCVEFCQFNALALAKTKPILFQELCHSCGGCELVCPVQGVEEVTRMIGKVESSRWKDLNLYTGIMNIGEVSGMAIIKKLFEKIMSSKENVIIDCPPGSGCSVMECVSQLDYCVFVAEPTLYGLHNFKMVLELAQILKKPFGVILNKVESNDSPTELFCKNKNIPILGKIHFDKDLGKLNAQGEIVALHLPEIKQKFADIYQKILKEGSIS